MNFTEQLLAWYRENKRDLPWRNTKDPYLVWLSEVILQQTRIGQGLPFFEKFAAAYPTVQQLAQADEREILKLWQGLGYYSRARNMHEASRMIVQTFNGKFPDTLTGIRSLKGVGDYTAAAIASIVYNLPSPVVDGNVMRFFSRYFGITESISLEGTKKRILEISGKLIDHKHPGDFNQAMMEFGARVCTPAGPGCSSCVVKNECFAFKHEMVNELPSRASKASPRSRYIHYMVITCTDGRKDFIYLNKRTGKDIWKNLFDFPQLEPVTGVKQDQPLNENVFSALFQSEQSKNKGYADQFNHLFYQYKGVSDQYDHLLTHQKLHAWFYRFHLESRVELPFILVPLQELNDYPVPRLVDKYLNDFLYKENGNHYLCQDDQP
jgi:A/G-specific adenine glycosylase